MSKESVKSRQKGNGQEYTRGPGKLTWRVGNLKKKMKPEQVREAEKIVKTNEYRVIQLAWYMAGVQRDEQRKQRMVARYREGLKKILGPDADHQV